MSGQLYGRCYYYVRRYNPSTDADAGAASKQLWDDLQGVAYEDDRIVITRIDHREDLSQLSEFTEIDIGRIPSPAFEQFTEALADDNVAHFLYVEVGPHDPGLVTFGLPDQGRNAQ